MRAYCCKVYPNFYSLNVQEDSVKFEFLQSFQLILYLFMKASIYHLQLYL